MKITTETWDGWLANVGGLITLASSIRDCDQIDFKNKTARANLTLLFFAALKLIPVIGTVTYFSQKIFRAIKHKKTTDVKMSDIAGKSGVIPSSKDQGVEKPDSARAPADRIQSTSNAMGSQAVTPPDLETAIAAAPAFRNYGIFPGTPLKGISPFVLTGVTVRPSTLFFRALFGQDLITLPGSGELFRITIPQFEVRQKIDTALKKNPEGIVSFSAHGHKGEIYVYDSNKGKVAGPHPVADLAQVYGDKTYTISLKEIEATLDSQKIYLSPMLPKAFYVAMKKAMLDDKMVILPGNDSVPFLLKELEHNKNYPAFNALLKDVNGAPKKYGFTGDEWESFKALTLYQIGSMVVKTEDYRIFIDGDGQMIERKPGDKDAILLINACGIRGFNAEKTVQSKRESIMQETFKTALSAVNNGIIIFPAVGMGVWRGDPGTYWPAFLDAVASRGDQLESILINPNHQKTRDGRYAGKTGEEFQEILDAHIKQAKASGNVQALANLQKIRNLRNDPKDVVQLAHGLKKAFPGKTVALFNASDPDVTLGYHVGEYTNNVPHNITTEENYTAMGTNGLCFEGVTKVHLDPARIVQMG